MAAERRGKLIEARGQAWELYAQWRHGGPHPAELWRRLRRIPTPAVEPFPARIEAFMSACRIYAAMSDEHVRGISAIVTAWAEGQAAQAKASAKGKKG